MLKIAVVAPIPSASVSAAMAVKPGDFRINRSAKRRSWIILLILYNGRSIGRLIANNGKSQSFVSYGDRSCHGIRELRLESGPVLGAVRFADCRALIRCVTSFKP